MFVDFRERGREGQERERNTDMKAKHRSPLMRTPTGDQRTTFWLRDNSPPTEPHWLGLSSCADRKERLLLLLPPKTFIGWLEDAGEESPSPGFGCCLMGGGVTQSGPRNRPSQPFPEQRDGRQSGQAKPRSLTATVLSKNISREESVQPRVALSWDTPL